MSPCTSNREGAFETINPATPITAFQWVLQRRPQFLTDLRVNNGSIRHARPRTRHLLRYSGSSRKGIAIQQTSADFDRDLGPVKARLLKNNFALRIRDQVSHWAQNKLRKRTSSPARLAMIFNGKLPDFACNVTSKGQITLGDVRRLQRNYLPGGITNREELEILISLNAKLVRADKAWAQWLVSAVADFIKTRKACEREDAGGKWIERLLATSATKLGLRIARQIRRELSRLRAIQLTRAGEGAQTYDVKQPRWVKVPEYESDESPACLRPSRYTVRHEMAPRTMTLASAAHGPLARGLAAGMFS